MKIYTRTGDKGETSLYKGGRVPKDSPRLEAYGTLDELNSILGQALALLPRNRKWATNVHSEVQTAQTKLFAVGAMLATRGSEPPAWTIDANDVKALEVAIDRMEADLPPLKTFILPGGHPAGATFHVARTVSRRSERLVVAVAREETIDAQIQTYLNRLSDYLFVLARYVNMRLERPETGLVI